MLKELSTTRADHVERWPSYFDIYVPCKFCVTGVAGDPAPFSKALFKLCPNVDQVYCVEAWGKVWRQLRLHGLQPNGVGLGQGGLLGFFGSS